MLEQPRASVAILTYNGEDYLDDILAQLRLQEFDGGFEIIVIDSGSTDSTLDIVARYPEVRLITIPNAEFGHGRTRNLAAREARGEFIAYLTHDAVPSDEHWLAELIDPFDRFPDVVAVLGKQVARPRAFPLQKYEIHGTFRNLGPDFGTTIFYDAPFAATQGIRDAMAFYSDVNSAARRAFLVDVLPYRNVRYAEDQLFGRDIIDSGYAKAYAGRASVQHSNDLTLAEYGHRIFDETVGLRQIGHAIPAISKWAAFRHSMRGTLGDSARIVLDRGYSWKRKLYWLAINPFFQFRKWFSYQASTHVDIADTGAIRAGSLEHKRKTRDEA